MASMGVGISMAMANHTRTGMGSLAKRTSTMTTNTMAISTMNMAPGVTTATIMGMTSPKPDALFCAPVSRLGLDP